jgi:hypothetical protein
MLFANDTEGVRIVLTPFFMNQSKRIKGLRHWVRNAIFTTFPQEFTGINLIYFGALTVS